MSENNFKTFEFYRWKSSFPNFNPKTCHNSNAGLLSYKLLWINILTLNSSLYKWVEISAYFNLHKEKKKNKEKNMTLFRSTVERAQKGYSVVEAMDKNWVAQRTSHRNSAFRMEDTFLLLHFTSYNWNGFLLSLKSKLILTLKSEN